MNARSILALIAMLCCVQPIYGSANPPPGATFFTNRGLHQFEVQLSEEHFQALRHAPREYVPALVRVNGRSYTNVGVHLKGVATFRPVDDQPSLTLNFSKFDRAQRFHGLRKIHLNNGKEDPTFLCEALSAELFAQAGLPAARVVHARTRLNGRDLGAYVAIEGFTPEFLARHFKDTSGNLYDSGFRHDITYPLERLLGKKPDRRQDLDALAEAARTPDLETRWSDLSRHLDTNGFARYLAMQVLIANWDGYALFKNNYRVYHDPETHHLHFMAHGMDQTFARPTYPLMPYRWDGLVARSFMETPQGRALYQHHLGQVYTNVYDTSALVQRVDELAAVIRPIFIEEGTIRDYDQTVAALRLRIAQRGSYLAREFSGTNWMNPPRRTPGPVRAF